jgi:sugar phosphate isomerase/epimerase
VQRRPDTTEEGLLVMDDAQNRQPPLEVLTGVERQAPPDRKAARHVERRQARMGRLAVSELTTLRWSFEEDVEHYRALDIPAIGVWRQKLADIGDERGAAMIAASGLSVSSLQWAGGFTGHDGHTHEESLTDARRAIRTAALIRARCLIVHSGARAAHTHRHARKLFREALDKLLPLAEEHGTRLAIEPMHSDSGGNFTFFHCLDETLELVGQYDSPAIGLALDTYHWGHWPGLIDRLPQLAPRLALVQLGDSRQPPQREPNRCLLGEGSIPLREIATRLNAAGYDGFYEVELMGEEIEALDYCEVLKSSRQTFDVWKNDLIQRPSSQQTPASSDVRRL